MSVRNEVRLYGLQRLTALILAPLVVVHLGVMVYAVQGGLSTAEMLSRTQANPIWPVYYGIFYTAAALHAAIGLRVIAREHTKLRPGMIDAAAGVFALATLTLGVRAVMAIS